METRNLPRDVFLHLLAIVTLYWSAISVITLCWQLINHWFPMPLEYSYGFSGAIRFALASLIIVFPVFLLISWWLNKIYATESAVRDSKIRKWLLYLTLFITALVVIGDLIFVVNTLLGGEFTARFILKALSVLIVAGAIFWYYLDDVRRSSANSKAKYVAWASGIIVLVLIVGAFFIVGSPKTARQQQYDQQRVSDLQNIQSQLVNYYQRKSVLPEKLVDLNDSISGFMVPVDPETNQVYEYSHTSNTQFNLCATFSLPSEKTAPVPAYHGGISENWNHGAGRVCFDRTIDPQLYPKIPVK